MREAAFKTRIGVHESCHLLGIACTDDDELASLILHAGHKSLHGFLPLARRTAPAFVHRLEVVSLIEE